MRPCVILAAAPQDLQLPQDCFLIAADGGLKTAARLNRRPDLAVGDWDSASKPADIPAVTLPHEKDDTDTHFAARWAVEQGYDEVHIYGALGGRLDHTIANLHTLYYLEKQGVRAVLYGEGAEAQLLTEQEGKRSFAKREGWYLSVFAFGGTASGVDEKGVYYPLTDATLCADFPVGVSNEFLEQKAEISVKKGNLLILQIKK
ncbi:MAG: thiamine diphosphokinase [Oscillospiraceae bacterium]|nr:thiamine diphosphokinase [Oscillospiraceae bacterium]